jgi:hypothetical protein
VMAPSSLLDIEIGGTAPGTDHDRLAVTGAATLDGALDVKIVGGYVPFAGDSFAVVTYGSHTGAFATTTGLQLGGWLALVPAYGATDFSLAAATSFAWTRLEPSGSGPNPREGHSAVYDAATDRMIVFGGYSDEGTYDDTWVLENASGRDGTPHWTRLEPQGALPPARWQHTAVYDPETNRMVVCGGDAGPSGGGGIFSDVWVLTHANGRGGTPAWNQLALTGPYTPFLTGHSAVYDPASNRLVAYVWTQVWVLSNANGLGGSPGWSPLEPTGGPPPSRRYHAAVYDRATNRMTIYGGQAPPSGQHSDAWVLTGANGLDGTPEWIQLAPTDTLPASRNSHSAVYHPLFNQMVVFGGNYVSGSPNNELLVLAGANGADSTCRWSIPLPSGPVPSERFRHTAVYDSTDGVMILFGGAHFMARLNDVWVLKAVRGTPGTPMSPWTRLTVPGANPLARSAHTTIYDPLRRRFVLFGGLAGTTEMNDVWVLPADQPVKWEQLTPTGTAPPVRFEHSAVYDATCDRMLVFGGRSEVYNGEGDHYFSDTWALELYGTPAWSQVAVRNEPPCARAGHSAVYDPPRATMVVFGGSSVPEPTGYLQDLWGLTREPTGDYWRQLAPAGPLPEARTRHGAIYDAARQRLIVFGGVSAGGLLDDVWTVTAGQAWSRFEPAGTPPPGMAGHAAAYDPSRDRMLVFGGHDGAVYVNRTRALSLGDSPEWTQLAPTGTLPSRRDEHTLTYDPTHDRILVFEGRDADSAFCDLWALWLGGPVSVPEGPSSQTWQLQVLSPAPNPARGSTHLRFVLAVAARVQVAVFDLAGRRTRELADGPFAAGPHEVLWDGRRDDGDRMPPGVYFSVVTVEGRERFVRRVVLLR